MQEISYLPGEGTVIVAGDTVLLLAAPAEAEVATTLWRLVVAGMSHDQVRAVLETYSPAILPDLAVASLRADGLALLLRGSVRASVVAHGTTTDYEDADRRPWTEYTIAHASMLRLWLDPPRVDEPAAGHGHGARRAEHTLPLVGGVARADSVLAGLAGTATPRTVGAPVAPPVPVAIPGYAPPAAVPPPPPMEGVFLDRPPAPAAPTPAAIGSISQVWVTPAPPVATPAPHQQPAPAGSWPAPAAHLASTDLAPIGSAPLATPGVAAQRPPVWATRCPQAHLNAPDAAVCRVCGVAIADREPSIVPRPPLGRLDFAEFGSVTLDSDLVIGREPGEGPTEGPRRVTIAHPSLSRRHVEVQVRDWLVAVVDLDSANGTTVVLPGRQPEPLRRQDPVPIHPGTVVWLGQHVAFTYVAQA